MKNKIVFYFIFLNFFVFSQGMPAELSTLLNDYLKNTPEKTQVSIAVIKNGETKFYGAIKENTATVFVANEEKLFEIGSITKVFTATMLAQLISDEKIKPTATIDQFFKFKLKDKTKVKLTDLANHTSGMPPLPFNFVNNHFLPDNPYKNYTTTDLESYLKNDFKLNSPPGTNYNYSNLGAGLLGFILGISQKKTYSQLLQTLIFEKYQLKNSYATIPTSENLVKGLTKEGNETSNWDFDALAGAGCVVSCTKDLAQFALAQFENEAAMNLTHAPTFSITETMKVALGWYLITQDATDYLWHNGGTGGYSSSMALNLKEKTGVIILTNNAPNGKLDDLCFEMMKLIGN